MNIEQARRLAERLHNQVVHVDRSTAIRFQVIETTEDLDQLRRERAYLEQEVGTGARGMLDSDAELLAQAREERRRLREQQRERLRELRRRLGED